MDMSMEASAEASANMEMVSAELVNSFFNFQNESYAELAEAESAMNSEMILE